MRVERGLKLLQPTNLFCHLWQERITISSTYWYVEGQPFTLRSGSTLKGSGALAGKGARSGGAAATASHGSGGSSSGGGVESNPGGTLGLGSSYCDGLQDQLDKLRARFEWQTEELQRVRHKCLPGY